MSVQALSAAFAVRGLTPSEKLVLLALANYAGPTLSCYPSQETISDDTELSERTVWGALKSLEEKLLITRQKRTRSDGTRSTDVFTLHLGLAAPVANPAKTSRKVCEDQSQPLRKPVAAVATPTTFEPVRPNRTDDVEDAREVDWNERLGQAIREAGEGVDLTATAVHTYRDLKALCEPSTGEPCTWDEVLDAVRFKAAKTKLGAKPLRSWTWVNDQAWAYRDRRLAGAPAVRAIATGPPGSVAERSTASWDEAMRRIAEDG